MYIPWVHGVGANAYSDPTHLQEPNAQRVEFSAKLCQNVTNGRLMSGSMQAGRGQGCSDAGPESFELRVFLKGLRQKQHRWGSAWGIPKRFNQRFCIERVLTQKSSQGYCLQDVAILTQGKSCCRLQPSCQLDFQLEMA